MADPGGADLRGPNRPSERELEVLDEAGRQLRAPWAASIAGVLFAILFTTGLALLRNQDLATSDDAVLARLFATGGDTLPLLGGLYLLPFSGIMFLWFIAVIRDQLGEREDRFFATVFFGSGLLFVALLFAADAVATAPMIAVRYLDQAAPTALTMQSMRALAYTLLFAFATRAAAVFLISAATIGLRSGALPRRVTSTGYVLGLILLVAVSFWEWFILVLPAWVAVVSLVILGTERSRRQAARALDPKQRPGPVSS